MESVFVVTSVGKDFQQITEDNWFKNIGLEPTGNEGTVYEVLSSTIIYGENELTNHREFERYRQDALEYSEARKYSLTVINWNRLHRRRYVDTNVVGNTFSYKLKLLTHMTSTHCEIFTLNR